MSAIDDFHQHILDLADDLDLSGNERDEYVDFHMTKRGYKRTTTWLPPEPDNGDEQGGSMFSRKKPQGGQKQGGQRQGGSHYFKGSGSK